MATDKHRTLLFLVADLLSDDDVVDSFLQDPEKTMDRYELDAEQRCALFSLDSDRIANVVSAEVRVNFSNSLLSPDWPVPQASISRIEPSSHKSGKVPEFHVYGEGLMRGATVILSRTGDSTTSRKYLANKAVGKIDKTILTVEQMDLKGLTPGKYRVTVRNCAHAHELVAPESFEVT